MEDCFDYSRCPLTSQFPVYVYPFDGSSTGSIFTNSAYFIHYIFTQCNIVTYIIVIYYKSIIYTIHTLTA